MHAASNKKTLCWGEEYLKIGVTEFWRMYGRGKRQGAVLNPTGRPLLCKLRWWGLQLECGRSERGEGAHLNSSVQGRNSVFHWISRWRTEETKMTPMFCILKMRHLGEIVIPDMGFGSPQHRGKSWNTEDDSSNVERVAQPWKPHTSSEDGERKTSD